MHGIKERLANLFLGEIMGKYEHKVAILFEVERVPGDGGAEAIELACERLRQGFPDANITDVRAVRMSGSKPLIENDQEPPTTGSV